MNKFKTWLQSSKIIHMDTIKGDLAKDIVADPNFPNVDDKSTIYNYMENQLLKNGTYVTLADFKALYSYYNRQNKRS